MSSTKLAWIACAIAFLLAPLTTLAQPTTQPINDTAWPATVDRFTKALTAGDTAAARASTVSGVTIARSGSNEQIDLATLVQRSSGGAMLASHLYTFPPIAMAADLAADFKSAPMIPEATKTLMIPTDDAAMQRANATAIQWVAQVLGTVQGTPFAVALILPTPTPDSARLPTPIIVLMRGTAEENGTFAVDRIVYGTPQQIIE